MPRVRKEDDPRVEAGVDVARDGVLDADAGVKVEVGVGRDLGVAGVVLGLHDLHGADAGQHERPELPLHEMDEGVEFVAEQVNAVVVGAVRAGDEAELTFQ